MEPIPEFSSLQSQVTSALVQSTRTSGQISSGDLNFQRSCDNKVAEGLDSQNARLIGLVSSLLDIATANSDLKKPDVKAEDGLEDNWRAVIDVIDELLEKSDANLDEFTGIIKRPTAAQEEQNSASKQTPAEIPSVYDLGPSKIPKPQELFHRSPCPAESEPFKPLLTSKPHATVSLEDCLTPQEGRYRHPYEIEIQKSSYPASVYESSPPQEYKPFESTTATFVDTIDGVHEMLAELSSAKEIAVDLEHHDLHSYHGIVSLMQISTRDKDWIVDTLKPWREELQVLNKVFADPSILKVLHGSTMDIIWLQRDLGLYMVGLFDTYHAAVALNYNKRSLKFLLDKFVNFQAQKKYQMADWRIRPLSPGMFDYARSDTHYLLYIYDHLRNELLENSTPEENKVDFVLERSKEEALQKYERPVYDAERGRGSGGWYDYLTRSAVDLSKEQFAVFKAAHQWRDAKAREHDEGVQVVLTKRNLFKLAAAMPLTSAALFNTVVPASSVLKEHASELLEIIREAKLAGATGPEMQNELHLPGIKFSTSAPKPSDVAAPDEQARPTIVMDSETQAKLSRSEMSRFWGVSLPGPSPPNGSSSSAPLEALRLCLPLPPDAAATELSDDESVISTPTKSSPPPEGPPRAEDVEKLPEVFTIKEQGGRQKRKPQTPAQSAAPSSQSLDGAADIDMAEDQASVLSLSQPSKKARKLAKKEASGSSSAGGSRSDTAPFDYSTADSVLHAKPDRGGAAAAGHKKPFDPYSKSLNAPQGMRKSKKDIPGKTFTFRQ
ncbi:Exosome component 10 [Arachnomyces sp. PD_36]|nr:Exosome component 10 [Arachnomyces sp. PD_36]